TMTKRGQVTVPAEVRRLLGLKPRDQVEFTIQDGRVEIRPAKYTLESVYQSVPALPEPLRGLSDKEIARIAIEDHVEQVVRRGRKREAG
ncbi:MAG TPA: type II toxin-antitoxin system PrlF family antitoxin, partial [Dehalococcoidia bacterium]